MVLDESVTKRTHLPCQLCAAVVCLEKKLKIVPVQNYTTLSIFSYLAYLGRGLDRGRLCLTMLLTESELVGVTTYLLREPKN